MEYGLQPQHPRRRYSSGAEEPNASALCDRHAALGAQLLGVSICGHAGDRYWRECDCHLDRYR